MNACMSVCECVIINKFLYKTHTEKVTIVLYSSNCQLCKINIIIMPKDDVQGVRPQFCYCNAYLAMKKWGIHGHCKEHKHLAMFSHIQPIVIGNADTGSI